ncbi:MAG: helix-turn-helix transcriptional regulator [Rhodocyclales bacterium]|nr:helix-turn-helix transcriptional regulator [Rhodocyclales bacterium]
MSSAIGAAAGRFGRISLLRVDRPVAAHAHPHCHALFKVGGADSFFEVAGERLPLVDDTVVLVNPWRNHGYPYDAARGGSRVLALYVEPDWLAELDRKFAAAARRDFFMCPCARVPDWMGALARAMAEELAGRSPDGARAIGLLEALMAGVIGEYSRGGAVRERYCGIGDRRIRRAVSLLRADPARDWDLAELAAAAALSRAHFFERFRAETGVTPRVYRNALRMETAYARLLAGEVASGDVARELGFAAPSHFSRFFGANHGVAPSAWLRAARRFQV